MKAGRFILAAWLLGAGTGLAESSLTGTWQGKAYFFRVNVQVVQWESNAAGVARVRGPFGGLYTYHFNGMIESNRLWGTHHSGHRFEGTRKAEDCVSGTLTTRRGRAIRLTLRRPSP